MAVIRDLIETDLPEAEQLLDATLGGRWQARLGELVDVLDLPGMVACDTDRIVGIVTWTPGGSAELACLAVAPEHRLQGIGGALVEATAAAVGAGSLWLVTTNDNLDSLRLYQRHGFRIERVVVGGVDVSRGIKRGIPMTGSHGIPLLDELVLRRNLRKPG